MAYKARIRAKKRKRDEKEGNDIEETEDDRLKRIRSGYINKQHVLVFASRGISYRYRHLMKDVRDLLPHSKKDVKFDSRLMNQVNEVCDMKGCNSCIYFDSRKRQDLYLWVSKTPNGPSVKFHVTNVHTMSELKFTGNCLKGSRPLIQFDANFDTEPHLKLVKELLAQVFSTPNMHPKSKPFVDHIINFYICDGRIWFRNYQVTEEFKPEKIGKDKTERVLVEIGPRLVLNPIKILSGSFFGAPLYENPNFISPSMVRALQKKQNSTRYVDRVISAQKREARRPSRRLVPDELDTVFDDDDNADDADDADDADVNNAHDNDESERMGA